MSEPINTGGLAFAAATCGDWQQGMSLRDWYAGLAMQGRLAQGFCEEGGSNPHKEAEKAFRMADAMISQREVTPYVAPQRQ